MINITRCTKLLLGIVLASSHVYASNSDAPPLKENLVNSSDQTHRLNLANQWLKQQQRDAARELLDTLAKEGNAEARYLLAYNFSLPPEEQLRHLEAAARQGHAKALKLYIDAAFYHAGFNIVEPKTILSVYQEAKSINPKASFFDERNTIKALKMASEVPMLGTDQFFIQYQLDRAAIAKHAYAVWMLAEEASIGGRFGDPDPTLTMQLILRESPAPAEMKMAIEAYHPHWKSGNTVPFKLCDHITSGVGMSVCAQRESIKAEEDMTRRISSLTENLDDESRKDVIHAFEKMSDFAQSRASNEEGHGGTMRNASVTASTTEQQHEFVNLVQKVSKDKFAATIMPLTETDKLLNIAYQNAMQRIRAEPKSKEWWNITEDGVRTTQRNWIKHRDSASLALNKLAPEVTIDQWKSYFTSQRTAQLNKVLPKDEY